MSRRSPVGLLTLTLLAGATFAVVLWLSGVLSPASSAPPGSAATVSTLGVSSSPVAAAPATTGPATSATTRPSPPTTKPLRPSTTTSAGSAEQQPVQSPVDDQPAVEEGTRITIAAVGDIMVHEPQIPAAYDAATGAYDFFPSFAPIAPFLEAADFAIGNFETRTAGGDRGYSGYPVFNSPDAIAGAVKEAGIDLVGTANNHCLDMGFAGLTRTLDTLDGYNLPHVGNYRSPAEQQNPYIADVKGIKVAFLNYTTGTNGIPVPAGKPWSVNLLGDGSGCIAAAARARSQGADLVIAMLHWGSEYQRTPNEAQRGMGARLVENGVDLVIGSHPHVVQAVQKITVARGDAPYTAYIAYSLGNFLSNQRDRYTDSGIVLYFDVEKRAGSTRVVGLRYLPTYVEKQPVGVHNEWRVLPLGPGIEPRTDVALSPASRARMAQVTKEMADQLLGTGSGIRACSAPDFSSILATPSRASVVGAH